MIRTCTLYSMNCLKTSEKTYCMPQSANFLKHRLNSAKWDISDASLNITPTSTIKQKSWKTFFHTQKLPVGSTFVHKGIEIC